MAAIRIGISNGTVPGNKKTFPPEFQLKSRLHYYSSLFNTIEVNSCFYKTPQRSTYEKWAADVPEDFQFTLKLTRDVTHVKDLKGDLSCMESFLQAAGGVVSKRGCLLLQFPGKISIEHFNQVEAILDALAHYDPGDLWRKAIEFRNDSWYIAETTELLNQYHAAMVLHDFKKAPTKESGDNADFVYIRFHGPTGNYRESYTDKFLKEQAELMKDLRDAGKEVYVYFNNTMGDAFNNALKLQADIAKWSI
jgi:uncharacterized protein YecE (DUF72 family)